MVLADRVPAETLVDLRALRNVKRRVGCSDLALWTKKNSMLQSSRTEKVVYSDYRSTPVLAPTAVKT